MKRNGRPLLVAAAGVAFVSFACEPKPAPAGNLRPPDDLPSLEDSGVDSIDDDSGTPSDAGAMIPPPTDIVVGPSSHPVGNLRPPEPHPPPDAGKKK